LYELAGLPFYFLGLFHLLFFWKVYSNPFSMARSELLSTFFPSWIHQGRGDKRDYFWLVPNAHPVLSSFYPPHKISAMLTRKLGQDRMFNVFVAMQHCHSFLASIGWFLLISTWTSPLVSVFGALVLTYSAYNIKQQPCILYTIAWFPWLLYGISTNNLWLSSLSCGMTLLAGYYPLGIQTLGVSGLASLLWGRNLMWVPLGILIGLPQLIPFIKYLPKTIRTHKVSTIGKVPWWHLGSLIFPKLFRSQSLAIGYWETSYYVGIVPLVLISSRASTSRVWILAVVSLLLMLGFLSKHLPRIPARFSFTFQFALGWWATANLKDLHLPTEAILALIIITCFDLWYNNSDLIPTLPYSELPKKPSRAFNTPLTRYLQANLKSDERVSGLPYPLFTGHINRLRTLGYSGGMQLKLMAKWRNDNNPDGSGEHDWFKSNKDGESLDRSRVKFAYSRKRLDKWVQTPIKYLWLNPRYGTG